ncbi:uncharacterized protein LOC135838728 [Planococcus citri]|uniref:uncharacterized protein LOC135838728 n=1 Tax=Planococcus citri TaxID=170843 RepID=UPI0031F79A8B
MSRSNKNNRKKFRLSRNGANEQPLCCSSSSGSGSSSNYSDDMDVIRNAVLESLMKNAGPASGAATTPTPKPPKTNDHPTKRQRRAAGGKSDDETRKDDVSFNAAATTTVVDPKLETPPVATTIEELAMAAETTPTTTMMQTRDGNDDPDPGQDQSEDRDQIRTDVKIVRIKTLDSEESKLLLIVDVLDRNPFRIEVNSEAAAAKRRRDEESAAAAKCIKVDIEALKRGECPKEIRNLCTKVRSRRIYKLPDELMRKFDQKGLKVFEWHSFNRPDEVIKLLLDDGGGAGAAGAATATTTTPVTNNDVLRKRMIIGFRRRSTTPAKSSDTDEPAAKIRRTATAPVPVAAAATGEAKLIRSGIRTKSRLATDQRSSRNRILHKLLKEYGMSSSENATSSANVWDTDSQNKINKLVRSHLDLRAKEANERANNRRKEPNNDLIATTTTAPITSAWKSTAVATEFAAASTTLKRDNLDAAKLSLNDDNDASVSNSNADVSAIDGNSDALNDSNNDDNDSKAKKKNRCALCRKKVGLTGFECRCGGLYCGIHRYSDKHNCTFDYRQLGAQEIRRNNPVVIGEKIQKI